MPCEEPPRGFFKQALQREFEKDVPLGIEYNIQNITKYEGKIAAWVSTVKLTGEKKDESKILYVLKPHDEELLIKGFYEQLDPNDSDVETGIYTSNKGKYSLTIPAGWIPLKGVWLLRSLTADSLTILAPDLESKVMIGLVQMPLKLDPNETIVAQKAVEADSAWQLASKREPTLAHLRAKKSA